MKTMRSWMTPNPILVKELRSRMRGPRAFITLTIALVIMAGLMIALVRLITSADMNTLLSPQIGHILFECLVVFVLILVCTVTPAVTAGAISSEREKQTFEMLLATPLGSAKLLWGKLISALSYVFILIFAAVPLASLVFLFGGVAPLALLKAVGLLVLVAITFGIYGLFLSALLGRTGRATIAAFVSVAVLTFAPLLSVILASLFAFGSQRMLLPRGLLAVSPVSTVLSAITSANAMNSGGVDSLFGYLGGQWNASMDPTALTQFLRPIYHYSLVIYSALSIILFTLTMALVHPSRRFFLSKRTALVGGGVLAVFALLAGGAFWTTAPRYEWVKSSLPPTAEPVILGPIPAQKVIVAPAEPAVPLPTPTPVTPPEVTPAPAAGYPAMQGPEATTTVVTAQGAAMKLEDQAAIYAAVARQIYFQGQPPEASTAPYPIIYLVSVTDDRVGDPNQPDAGPVSFDTSLLNGITAALSGLPARLGWVNSLDRVPKDDKGGIVLDGGIAVTFGNIQVQQDGSVQLPASYYLANMNAGGRTYVLEKVESEWQVTGDTGAFWIS